MLKDDNFPDTRLRRGGGNLFLAQFYEKFAAHQDSCKLNLI